MFIIPRKLKSTETSSPDQHKPQSSESANETKHQLFDVSAQNGEQYDNVPNYITILPDPPIVQYQNTPDVVNNVASEEVDLKYEDVVNVEENNRNRTNQVKSEDIKNETGDDNEEEDDDDDDDDDDVYCYIDDKEIRSYNSPADDTREVEADKPCIVLRSNNNRHSKV